MSVPVQYRGLGKAWRRQSRGVTGKREGIPGADREWEAGLRYTSNAGFKLKYLSSAS